MLYYQRCCFSELGSKHILVHLTLCKGGRHEGCLEVKPKPSGVAVWVVGPFWSDNNTKHTLKTFLVHCRKFLSRQCMFMSVLINNDIKLGVRSWLTAEITNQSNLRLWLWCQLLHVGQGGVLGILASLFHYASWANMEIFYLSSSLFLTPYSSGRNTHGRLCFRTRSLGGRYMGISGSTHLWKGNISMS